MRKPPSPSLLSGLLARLRRKRQAPVQAAQLPLRPFQAISIHRGAVACAMAKKFSEHRFLVRDAPTLPFVGCTMRETCQCKYIKHKDRRSDPRRLIDFGVSVRLFDGKERRQRSGRRTSDKP